MKKKLLSTVLSIAMVASLAGCGSSSAPADTATGAAEPAATETTAAADTATADTAAEPVSGEDPQAEKNLKILSIWAEDNDNGILINKLCQQYKDEVNPNFTWEYEYVASADLTTKVSTLAASNDLPDIFVYESGSPLTEMVEEDKVVDITEVLKQYGCESYVTDAATALLSDLSNTPDIYDLPLGLNVEGFWYNKDLFKQAGVEVPNTWDEFETVLETLNTAGIQPLSCGAGDGWGATRLVNAYTVRTLGADAMKKAAAGEANYTDEGYVAAAAKMSEWAEKGYFGEGVNTVDMNTAGSMLCTGQAAIFYNGSWFVSNLNDESFNPGGNDAIGFFNIPVVDESVSSSTAYSMNCGNVLCFSKDKYDDATGWFIKYFVENMGNIAMSEQGAVKGFTYDVTGEVSPYTQLVLDEIGKASEGFTWYEATMGSAVSSEAQANVKLLLSGEMSAQDYMQSIQDVYDMTK